MSSRREADRRRAAGEERSVAPVPALNEFWIDGEGIDRQVLQIQITRYLGGEATCRPMENGGRQGFSIRAVRTFTPAMMDDLRRKSAQYLAESQRSTARSGNGISYMDSATFRDSDQSAPAYPPSGQPYPSTNTYTSYPYNRPSTYTSDDSYTTTYPHFHDNPVRPSSSSNPAFAASNLTYAQTSHHEPGVGVPHSYAYQSTYVPAQQQPYQSATSPPQLYPPYQGQAYSAYTSSSAYGYPPETGRPYPDGTRIPYELSSTISETPVIRNNMPPLRRDDYQGYETGEGSTRRGDRSGGRGGGGAPAYEDGYERERRDGRDLREGSRRR